MAPKKGTTKHFEIEDYTKVEILEAFKAAGKPHTARTKKPDLIVAYGQLKMGPSSSVRSHLIRGGPKADAPASAPSAPAEPKSGSKGASNGAVKLWVRRSGSNRGTYGKAFVIDGDQMVMTLETGDRETTFAISDLEAAGPEVLRKAIAAAGGIVSDDGIPTGVAVQDAG